MTNKFITKKKKNACFDEGCGQNPPFSYNKNAPYPQGSSDKIYSTKYSQMDKVDQMILLRDMLVEELLTRGLEANLSYTELFIFMLQSSYMSSVKF